ALDFWVQLLGTEHVQQVHIHLLCDQEPQGLLVTLLVHQVREQHENSLARVSQAEILDSLGQRGILAWLDSVEEFLHAPQTAAAAGRRARLPAARSQRLDLPPIRPAKANKAQSRRQPLGVLQLRRLAKIHAAAGVDQRVKVQILFFQKQLQIEAFQS